MNIQHHAMTIARAANEALKFFALISILLLSLVAADRLINPPPPDGSIEEPTSEQGEAWGENDGLDHNHIILMT